MLLQRAAVEDEDVDIPEEGQGEVSEEQETREETPELPVVECEMYIHIERERRKKIECAEQHQRRRTEQVEPRHWRQVCEEQIDLSHAFNSLRHEMHLNDVSEESKRKNLPNDYWKRHPLATL